MQQFFNPDAVMSCTHYPTEWQKLADYIRHNENWDSYRHRLGTLHQIEAKALHIFSIARRIIRSGVSLANNYKKNWKPIFFESSIILYPMIELIGHTRLGLSNMRQYGNRRLSGDNLIAGIEWLFDFDMLPQMKTKQYNPNADGRTITTFEKHMVDHSTGPCVSDLYQLRNYFLHGAKEYNEKVVQIPDVLNYEIPKAISEEAQTGIRRYWELLLNDDSSIGWVERLADADVRPFIIQGSGQFEKGLIDPDIVEYLTGNQSL